MARSHGKILVDVWLDPDWVELDPQEHWTYFMLLSQAKLTLVGSIDYRPHHWSEYSRKLTPDRVHYSCGLLEDAGYVCIDIVTEELLVRSMTRHDGLRTGNPKLLKGLWTAWKGVASRGLRKVAVDNMPDPLFDPDITPPHAWEMRRSPRMDWSIERPTERSIEPPSTIHRPITASAQSVSESLTSVDNPAPGHRFGLVDSMRANPAKERSAS